MLDLGRMSHGNGSGCLGISGVGDGQRNAQSRKETWSYDGLHRCRVREFEFKLDGLASLVSRNADVETVQNGRDGGEQWLLSKVSSRTDPVSSPVRSS